MRISALARSRRLLRRIGQPFPLTHPEAYEGTGAAAADAADPHLMPFIPASEFAARRARVAARLPPSTALIVAAPETPMLSHDVPHLYRTCADMAYLSGYLEPGAVLVIERDLG
jgi:hypothetical protein